MVATPPLRSYLRWTGSDVLKHRVHDPNVPEQRRGWAMGSVGIAVGSWNEAGGGHVRDREHWLTPNLWDRSALNPTRARDYDGVAIVVVRLEVEAVRAGLPRPTSRRTHIGRSRSIDPMFARVAAISAPGAAPGQGADFFRERVLPDLRRYEGFQEAMLLVPEDGAEVLVISIWDTEEHLRAAETMPAPHRRSAAAEALGPGQRRDVRIYEVAVRAGGR